MELMIIPKKPVNIACFKNSVFAVASDCLLTKAIITISDQRARLQSLAFDVAVVNSMKSGLSMETVGVCLL